MVPFAGKILNLVKQPMMYVMQEMVESLKRVEMELLIAICWAAWHARNLFIFETKQVDLLNALAKAEAIIVL